MSNSDSGIHTVNPQQVNPQQDDSNEDPSVQRFRLLDLDDSPESEDTEASDTPDTEEPNIVTIEVQNEPHIVGGAPGWYAGDVVHRTSDGACEAGDAGDNAGQNDGIVAKLGETATERALRLFGMDREYVLEPVFRPTGERVPHQNNVVMREPDGSGGTIVSRKTVSPRYKVIQPRDGFTVIDSVMKDPAIDRGGILKKGAQMFLQTRQGSFETPSGPAETRLTIIDFFDGTGHFEGMLSGVVAECRNFLNQILRTADHRFRIRHTASASDKLETIKKLLEEVSPVYFGEAQKLLFAMGRTAITEKALNRILDALPFPKDKDGVITQRGQKRKDEFISVYETAPGAQPGTAWGVAQAITYSATHSAKEWIHGKGAEGQALDNLLLEKRLQGSVGNWERDAFGALYDECEELDKMQKHIHVQLAAFN